MFTSNPFCHNILLCKRYVDDVFCISKGSQDTLYCVSITLVYSIKLNAIVDTKSVTFLDTTVILEGSTVGYRPTYTLNPQIKTALHAYSTHPSN